MTAISWLITIEQSTLFSSLRIEQMCKKVDWPWR